MGGGLEGEGGGFIGGDGDGFGVVNFFFWFIYCLFVLLCVLLGSLVIFFCLILRGMVELVRYVMC